MAKTIEELKQMIDSVIVENGKGQITGQGLNLVLNEMSDALSEMGGGGGGAYQIHIPTTGGELTEEQIAFNAQQFAVLEPKLQNKEFVQVGAGVKVLGTGFMCVVIPQVMYGDLMGTGINAIFLTMNEQSTSDMFILNSDGTITTMG